MFALTHFKPMLHLYFPGKHQKIFSFLMLYGSKEMDQWFLMLYGSIEMNQWGFELG